MTTADQLNVAMRMLADAGGYFIGQGVGADGVATYKSLDGIPMDRRLELPVIEEMQVGIGAGLSICDPTRLPILIFPRCDFLLRAADALVNHLDKLAEMSCGQFVPKVIIRARVGTRTPLDPGPQHQQDHTDALRLMLKWVVVERIATPDEIIPTYERALARPGSTLVIEALG